MCKQIDNSLVNAINADELCNNSSRCHLKLIQLFKNLDQELTSNCDNNTDASSETSENASSDAGLFLLEDFPKRNEHKSIFSTFQNKDRSNSRRRRRVNANELTIDAMDVTIRDGLRNMCLNRRGTTQPSDISNQQVKYASLDSEQLEQLKNCTRICLSASHNNARKNMVDIEQSIRKNGAHTSIRSMENQQCVSSHSFNTV